MRKSCIAALFALLIAPGTFFCQNLSDFESVNPALQSSQFVFPNSHVFQKIIEKNDAITNGTIKGTFDFTAYVPNGGSSTSGRLSINHEATPGGVTAMDITFDPIARLWFTSNATELNFTSVAGTARNCSGGITPWGNVISCEEISNNLDTNNDGYRDLGWHVETNPSTKTVVRKLWALGNGPKENIALHTNRRTAYFGNDTNPGYLFKYVATNVDDLTAGSLYVYQGSKNGSGLWLSVPNTTATERNTTMTLCKNMNATIFNGIEDVEIGPDQNIYLAVKNESRVYRFTDSDPLTGTTVPSMTTYVGNASYAIVHSGGNTTVPWGSGNDNLAFDNQGNLWVLQDGGNNYIWVVLNGHTQAAPMVKIFGIAPAGSEPTGLTFTPDFKFAFLSFQHPSSTNNIDVQYDVAGSPIGFHKDVAVVIGLASHLGPTTQGQNTTNVGIGTYTPHAKLHIHDGDVYIDNIARGVILKSQDGNCWRITVGITGQLNAAQILCPQ
jgi:uncharacterized protein